MCEYNHKGYKYQIGLQLGMQISFEIKGNDICTWKWYSESKWEVYNSIPINKIFTVKSNDDILTNPEYPAHSIARKKKRINGMKIIH